MNWTRLRKMLWIDTRFRFLQNVPAGGSLLDIGSSEGQTISHFKEARPDLVLHATDLEGKPELYPAGTRFHRGDITADALPWADASMDAITCMHLVEHISSFDQLFKECNRLLKKGGALYIETPHPKTLSLSMPYASQAGKFTYNFYDDLTHQQIMPLGKIASLAAPHGFSVVQVGTSRNWLFAALFPFSFFLSPRKKIISRVHFIGWSAYVILRKR
jgi:ubiquinone/menaquinone biosynthesis C-methylase UbiE